MVPSEHAYAAEGTIASDNRRLEAFRTQRKFDEISDAVQAELSQDLLGESSIDKDYQGGASSEKLLGWKQRVEELQIVDQELQRCEGDCWDSSGSFREKCEALIKEIDAGTIAGCEKVFMEAWKLRVVVLEMLPRISSLLFPTCREPRT